MVSGFVYAIVAVLLISSVSLIGIFFLGLKISKFRKILIYLVSFSAGALFADAFFHLIPEASEHVSNFFLSLVILFGILLFFFLEKIVLWNHCHMPITKNHVYSFAFMNLIGDALHNFIDGLIIIASFIISTPVGIATSLAVLFHEIPQEIGDFGILVHGGMNPRRALLANFLISLTALIGVLFGFFLFFYIVSIGPFILLVAAGGFIYIAGSDLIPELHKQNKFSVSLLQILFFILGVVVIGALLLLEP